MDAVGIVLAFILFGGSVVLIWYCDKKQAAREAKEDAELREIIKHLPIEKQAEIWQTHYRLRAEQDF